MSLLQPRRVRAFPRLALLALPVLALLPGSASAQASVQPIVRATEPAVVSVAVRFLAKAGQPGDPQHAVSVQRPGSGVLVDVSGLVLTNAHLVAEAPDGPPRADQEFWPVVQVGAETYQVEVVARDERADLALLRIVDAGERAFPALPIAPAGASPAGARAVAVARPQGGSTHVFAGVLAAANGPVGLRQALLDADEVVISDARFHDLLDGAPLLDGRGRVLGLHNSSHISVLPPGFSTPPGQTPPPSKDYAVIVSARAIERALGEHVADLRTDSPPLAGSDVEAETAVAAIAPSVVSVWTGEGPHPSASEPGDPNAMRIADTLGSGVVVDASGLIVTSADVFAEDATRASVRLASGTVLEAEVVQHEAAQGVVLLRVAPPAGTPLVAATLADSEAAIAGQFVAVVGRPHGGALTLSVGVLSARERDGHVQVASWVHRGHWGGALIDRDGHLLGVAVNGPEEARVTEESYLGFAVPTARILTDLGPAWAVETEPPTPVATDAATRVTDVSRVVEATHGSLINVMVSEIVERKASGGANPFARPSAAPEYRLLGQGSGVIIDESGLALSNWHVVRAALDADGAQSARHKVEVTLPGGERYDVQVLSTSRDDDLSLLRLVLAEGETLTPVALGDSGALRLGEPVIAIGNPLGLSDSVSAGIVSCLRSPANIRGRARTYHGMLMTDAPINPGNSGGALLDGSGRLVGINSAGSTGMGLAIPVNKALEVFNEKLLSVQQLRSSYFGISVLETGDSVIVESVDALGPAGRAGVQAGDRVVRVGGRAVETAVDFVEAQLGARPGADLAVVVERAGAEQAFEFAPLPFTAWRLFRQTGILVEPVDYADEADLVQTASVELYRAQIDDPDASPQTFMTGALRVTGVAPLRDEDPLDVRAGDLLLGVTTIVRRLDFDIEENSRFETLESLQDAVDAAVRVLETGEFEVRRFWVLRDGEIRRPNVFLQRAPR